jgi:tetratricopeptide (TPR) repeat protein
MAMQRRWLIASLMLTTASVAQAQVTEMSRAALITEALNADVAVALAKPALDKSQMPIYIGSKADAPLLRDITFRLNDSTPVRYDFSNTEMLALRGSALYRTTLAGIKDGANQLIIDFHTANLDDKGISVFKHGQLTKKFSSNSALQLILNKGSLISDAAFESTSIDSGNAAAQIAVADFMMADSEYFAAASMLTRLSATNSGAQYSEPIAKRLGICRTALETQAPVSTNGSSDLVLRFNQALALVQQDQGAAATTALDAIGNTETTDSSALALRDQANLVLAYYFLNHSQGAEAIPAFERIRSPGPFANAGLLGLGWALLQPPHREGGVGTTAIPAGARYPTIMTPRLTADIVALKQEQAPRVPVANKDQQNSLRKAMVPWIELTGRDPTDPAVQEGMLAIAWTMYHFGAYAQAQDSYMRAADQFNKMRGWYDRAIQNVRTGGMATAIAARDSATDNGWSRASATLPPAHAHWWHGDTPETPKVVDDNFYFERLLLDDDFAEALQDYRNLLRIDVALKADAAQISASDSGNALQSQLSALSPALSVAITEQRRKLEAIATAKLLTQKQQLEKYLIEARFALATIYDRPELVSAQ